MFTRGYTIRTAQQDTFWKPILRSIEKFSRASANYFAKFHLDHSWFISEYYPFTCVLQLFLLVPKTAPASFPSTERRYRSGIGRFASEHKIDVLIDGFLSCKKKSQFWKVITSHLRRNVSYRLPFETAAIVRALLASSCKPSSQYSLKDVSKWGVAMSGLL